MECRFDRLPQLVQAAVCGHKFSLTTYPFSGTDSSRGVSSVFTDPRAPGPPGFLTRYQGASSYKAYGLVGGWTRRDLNPLPPIRSREHHQQCFAPTSPFYSSNSTYRPSTSRPKVRPLRIYRERAIETPRTEVDIPATLNWLTICAMVKGLVRRRRSATRAGRLPGRREKLRFFSPLPRSTAKASRYRRHCWWWKAISRSSSCSSFVVIVMHCMHTLR